MKKTLITLYLFIICLGLVSCKKQTQQTQFSSPKISTSENEQIPCCEVSCRRGCCKNFSGTCSCVSLANFPICGPTDLYDTTLKESDFSGIVVETSKDLMHAYDEDIQYLKSRKDTRNAIQSLENIKKIMIENNYILDTPELIIEYRKNVRKFVECIKNQPVFVREKMGYYD